MWAFSDESERANVMLAAVVLVHPSRLEGARARLRSLLLPGQRRIHTAKESARRRRLLLDTISDVEDLSATVVRLRRVQGMSRSAGRHLLLQGITGLVVGSGVTSWTLDDSDPATRARDRASVAHALSGVEGRLPRTTTTGPPPPSHFCGQPMRSAGL